MKSILLITPYFYPESFGLENYAFQVAKRLAQKNYRITVITGTYKKQDYSETIDNIKIIRKKCDLIISNTPIRFFLLKTILCYINNNKVDLIHAHTPVPYYADIAALASSIKKIPFLITYHASDLKKGVFWIDSIASIYLPIQYFTLRRANKIIAVAGNIKDKLLVKWKSKIEIITPGVDPTVFTYQPYNERYGNKIIFVGSLKKATRWKGLEILLKALVKIKQKIPDIHLTVAGSGDMQNYYINLSQKLGINNSVKFIDQLNHKELAKKYQESKAVIIPTTAGSEGCPTVMFEAMASGTPLIASRIAGIPHIIEHEKNGYLFEPGNHNVLSNLIIKILTDSSLAEKMSNIGYEQIINKYTWQKISNKYSVVYDKLIQ